MSAESREMFLKGIFQNDLVSVQCSDVTGTKTGLSVWIY